MTKLQELFQFYNQKKIKNVGKKPGLFFILALSPQFFHRILENYSKKWQPWHFSQKLSIKTLKLNIFFKNSSNFFQNSRILAQKLNGPELLGPVKFQSDVQKKAWLNQTIIFRDLTVHIIQIQGLGHDKTTCPNRRKFRMVQ